MATNNEKVESIKELKIFLKYMIEHNKKHFLEMQDLEKKISSINKSADNKFLSAMDSFQEGIKKLEDTFDIVKELWLCVYLLPI